MTWQAVVNVASLLGGVFALLAMWLYLRPNLVVSAETYEYIIGSGNRVFRVLVKNAGNVPVSILRFEERFQDGKEPDGPRLRRVFEGRSLPAGAEAAAWLKEGDMRYRTGFSVVYRGWYERRVEVDFDVGRHGVEYIMVAQPGQYNIGAEAEVHRSEDQVNKNAGEGDGR